MKGLLLDSRFTRCDCVYSSYLKRLIPVLLLTPKDSDDNNIIDEEGCYIDHFSYEFSENFDRSSLVIRDCLVDIATKEAYFPKTIIITDDWIDEKLIGERFIKLINGDRRFAKMSTISKIYIPKSIKDIKDTRGRYYIKEEEVNNFISLNKKRVICEVVDNQSSQLVSNNCSFIVEIIEPYIDFEDAEGMKDNLNFITLVK